ncbi:MAG: SPOR domain-containing protein [bacterium]
MHLSFVLILLSLIILLPSLCHGSITYYYLHVGSFQSWNNATDSVKQLGGMGLPTVVRGVEIPQSGYWYRVYVGPFSVRLDAELMGREIRQKRVSDYAKIIRKNEPLSSNLEEIKRPSSPPAPEVIPTPAKEVPPPAPEVPPPVAAAAAPPAIASAAVPSPAETSPPAAGPSPPPPPPMEKIEKAPKTRRQRGRNMRGGRFAVGLKHRFREVYTLVTRRTEITSTGITPVTLGSEEKDDFPTTLHLTTLCMRLGLTDYWEIYADIGASYDEPSEPGLTYGGGMRINLLSFRSTGLYTALQGYYMSGDAEEEYTSDLGNRWRRETTWEEVMGMLEVGIARPRWSLYGGGVYFMYEEDTDRHQLENLDPALTYRLFRDEVEQEEDIGAYAGIGFSLTPSLLLTIEGHFLTQEGFSLSLEQHF